jgi:c-di-GMP-binding flagellar brake protein YcgR
MAATTVKRRRYERVPFFADVAVRTAENGRLLPARSVDFSLGGIGLVTTVALVPRPCGALPKSS